MSDVSFLVDGYDTIEASDTNITCRRAGVVGIAKIAVTYKGSSWCKCLIDPSVEFRVLMSMFPRSDGPGRAPVQRSDGGGHDMLLRTRIQAAASRARVLESIVTKSPNLEA